MARVADHAGYMSNYFRWFGSPEDPFGWYYNLLALMTHVSDASIWIRLPDLICALVCWLLLSREVLPRLGPAVVGQPRGDVGGRAGAAGGVDAVQQRAAPRRPDRHRRTDHLRADRAGHQLRQADSCRAGDHHRRVHARHPAHRPDRGGRAGGRWPADPAHPGPAPRGGRHLAAGGAAAGRGHRRPDGGVRRPDAGNGVGSHQDPHRDRPQPGVVHREPALLLPDPADHRRRDLAAVRVPVHRDVPVPLAVHHVAAQADSRRGPRSGMAADGRHLRARSSS